jgi:hypothetical protein
MKCFQDQFANRFFETSEISCLGPTVNHRHSQNRSS